MPQASHSPKSDGPLCALVVVALVVAAWPFAEIGFVDDWSYIKSAQVFAQTGHFVYNGWATAMLGWQIPVGALFIKLFGFSFTAPRICTLCSAFASIWLFNRILDRFGLNRRSNIFGCLMLGLSPLFIPLASSFMTDVNGLLVLLVCLYMCLRALAADSDRSAFTWLILAALINVAGGTVRQISWLGVLVLVPSAAWLMRRRRGALLLGAALTVIGLIGIAAIMHWWGNLPGSMSEPIVDLKAWKPHQLPHVASYLLKAVLQFSLVLFPILAAWLWFPRTFSSKVKFSLLAFTGLLIVGSIVLAHHHHGLSKIVVPWTEDTIANQAVSSFNYDTLGLRPVSLPLLIRTILAIGVVVALISFCISFMRMPIGARLKELGRSTPNPDSWQLVLGLTLPLFFAYWCLLLPRAAHFQLYDRYYLGVLPFVEVFLLKLYEEYVGPSLPALSYLTLILMGGYSIAATHDWVAMNRAVETTAERLMQTGVARNNIQGGGSFDGWTQIEAAGFINDPRGHHVPYDSNPPIVHLPKLCQFQFTASTPVVHPLYFLSTQPLPCLALSQFGSDPYSTWLPPHDRAIYVLQRP